MEETEHLVELMHANTDKLVVNILEAVTQIIAEKKLVRRHFAEKRHAIDTELDRVRSRGHVVNVELFPCFLCMLNCSCDAKNAKILTSI